METIDAVVKVLQMGMAAFGIGMIISGGFAFGTAQSENNAAEKMRGINTMIGGGLIGVIGVFVVPLLSNVFTM